MLSPVTDFGSSCSILFHGLTPANNSATKSIQNIYRNLTRETRTDQFTLDVGKKKNPRAFEVVDTDITYTARSGRFGTKGLGSTIIT